MELLTHFLFGARKLGTRWYTRWLRMALSLGRRMEKRWEEDGKSVGEWQTIFFAWLYEGTTERDWMTSNSRTAFVLPFISRRCTLHTLANFAFTPFCSLLLFRSCFSRLYPVFVLPTVLVACSPFFFLLFHRSSFLWPTKVTTANEKIGIAKARNRGMDTEYRTINIKVRRMKIIKCTRIQRFRKLFKILLKICNP